MPRHLHIDPLNGIAGDMLLAALVHLGAPEAPISDILSRIPFPGVSSVALAFPEVRNHGILGRRLEITIAPHLRPARRSYGELRSLLQSAPLADRTRQTALAVFDRAGLAEARAGGIAVEDVKFHELGGFDTVIDLVGVALALEALDVRSISCAPIPLSRGYTRCDHGVHVTPAPATVDILTGVPTRGVDVEGEIVTVTGAALAVSLASTFGPPPPMTLQATAAGFGSSDFPGRPNCLRLFLGETQRPVPAEANLTVLEANLDDLSPEVLATLPETCIGAGALDAWLSPVLMKKGRPGHVLHALCDMGATHSVEEAIFRNSSTLGVRRYAVERRALERTWEVAETVWGPIRVKIGWLAGDEVNRAPEFEDCRKAAERSGVPIKSVYEAALTQHARKSL